MSAGRPACARAGGLNLLWLVPVWYLVTRLGVVALLSGPAATSQREVGGLVEVGYREFVTIWDGQWYQRIAMHGYTLPLPLDMFGAVVQSEWAFFPVFPLLVRVVMGAGLPFWVAAELVNLVAGGLAAWLGYLLFATGATRLAGAGTVAAHRRTAAIAVALWLLYPATTVLQIAYTEAVGLMLVLAALWALNRHRYGVALVLVVLLGFTRAVAAPLAVVVVVHLVMRWRRERPEVGPAAWPDTGPADGSAAGPVDGPVDGSVAATRPVGVPRWWLGGLAVLGGTVVAGMAWPVLVGWLTGRSDAFFAVQATWGQRPERGPFLPWWTWLSWHYGTWVAVLWVVLLALVCAAMLTRYAAWMPLELRAWGVVYPLYIFAVAAPSTSMIRFLIFDLPIFGVLAAVLMGDPRRGRSRRWWPIGPILCLPVLAWGVYWWATVLLVFTPPMDWPP